MQDRFSLILIVAGAKFVVLFKKREMTKLSVNVNKVATLRNSRGGDVPNLLKVAKDLQAFGAQGITVHPRPDQRHIRYADAKALPAVVTTEYNIEGIQFQHLWIWFSHKTYPGNFGTRCRRCYYL